MITMLEILMLVKYRDQQQSKYRKACNKLQWLVCKKVCMLLMDQNGNKQCLLYSMRLWA